jgi:plasmid stabilization system protein ParE
MEHTTIKKVILRQKAQKDLLEIVQYISKEGFPERAAKYGMRLFDFCQTLGIMPDKFPFCRKKAYHRYQYRCVPFEQTYVVVYRIEKYSVVIKHIIHGKKLA